MSLIIYFPRKKIKINNIEIYFKVYFINYH